MYSLVQEQCPHLPFSLCYILHVYLSSLQFHPIVKKFFLILLIFTWALVIFPSRLWGNFLLICRAKDQLVPMSLLHWQRSHLNSWSDRWSASTIFPTWGWWSSSRDLARPRPDNDLTQMWHDIFLDKTRPKVRQYFKQLLWDARWKHGHERYCL